MFRKAPEYGINLSAFENQINAYKQSIDIWALRCIDPAVHAVLTLLEPHDPAIPAITKLEKIQLLVQKTTDDSKNLSQPKGNLKEKVLVLANERRSVSRFTKLLVVLEQHLTKILNNKNIRKQNLTTQIREQKKIQAKQWYALKASVVRTLLERLSTEPALRSGQNKSAEAVKSAIVTHVQHVRLKQNSSSWLYSRS